MRDSGDKGRILCFATQGAEHLDGERLAALLAPLEPELFPFDRRHKLGSAVALLRAIRGKRPSLVVMEGTGMAGGVALILANLLLGTPYAVSSGDAVGPYLRLHSRPAGLLGTLYERLLCRRCAGYIGWTPYLVGRALTFGAPRGISVPGWARPRGEVRARSEVRRQLGIAEGALVIGLVGSLNWRAGVGYAYGAELVQAVRASKRDDLVACIVGEGSGREHLERLAGEDLGSRVLIPGAVPAAEVYDYLGAFDLASLPQSVDGVGSFRYTTKLAEYLEAGLPVVTGQIPAAYDLDAGQLWRLPGPAPWSPVYIEALAALLDGLAPDQLSRHAAAVSAAGPGPFQREPQEQRLQAFIGEILAG